MIKVYGRFKPHGAPEIAWLGVPREVPRLNLLPYPTRTRDLLLRSAGHPASRRQPAPLLPHDVASDARWRWWAIAGIVIRIVIKAGRFETSGLRFRARIAQERTAEGRGLFLRWAP